MRQLVQLHIIDRGTPDLEMYFVLSKNPLAGEPIPPSKILTWRTETTDFWVAYWYRRDREPQSDEDIKKVAERDWRLI